MFYWKKKKKKWFTLFKSNILNNYINSIKVHDIYYIYRDLNNLIQFFEVQISFFNAVLQFVGLWKHGTPNPPLTFFVGPNSPMDISSFDGTQLTFSHRTYILCPSQCSNSRNGACRTRLPRKLSPYSMTSYKF